MGAGGKASPLPPDAASPVKKAKVDKEAIDAWVALDPLKGVSICRNWAAAKGQCSNGKAKGCTRPHAYPASVGPAEEQAYVAWVLAKP